MIPKWEEVEVWLKKAEIPEHWHKWIAKAAFLIIIVVVLTTMIGLIKDLFDSKEVINSATHTVTNESSIKASSQTSSNGNNNLPCGNPGDFSPKDDSHQREAWGLLEKALAEMQSNKAKDSINMRLIEEARHDWDKGHTREALLKFRAALGCS